MLWLETRLFELWDLQFPAIHPGKKYFVGTYATNICVFSVYPSTKKTDECKIQLRIQEFKYLFSTM